MLTLNVIHFVFEAVDPRFTQAGGTNDPKTWGTPPSDMVDLEVKFIEFTSDRNY